MTIFFKTSKIGQQWASFLLGLLFSLAVFAQEAEFAPENQLKTKLRSAANVQYNLPLRFDVVGNGVELLPLRLEYDLQASQGRQLHFGNKVFIDGKSFFVALMPINRLDRNLQHNLPPDSKSNWVFLLRFPELLFKQADLEVLSRDGRVLWRKQLTEKVLKEWSDTKQQWAETYLDEKIYKSKSYLEKPVFLSQFGLEHAEKEMDFFWQTEDWIKFCLSQKTEVGLTRLCSGQYEVSNKGKNTGKNTGKNSAKKANLELRPLILSEQPAKVFISGEPAPLSYSEPVKTGERMTYFAELSTGITVEFSTIPVNLRLTEMTELANNRARVVGEGSYPLQAYQSYTQETVTALEDFFGWEQTIGDFREYWITEIPLNSPYVMFAGVGGGVFKQEFKIEKIPREELRPYLSTRTPYSTYVDGISLAARKGKSVQVNSDQNSVELNEEDPTLFQWSFGAPVRGDYNRSYLIVENAGQKFKAYHEMYKGFPREFSFRLSGVYSSTGSLIVLGEGAFNYWFEDFFGWSNYYLSRQRWGVSAKTFSSLSSFQFGNFTSVLKTNTFDLKYRLTPGLWSRDESWGLMGSYQGMTYADFKADMLGGGFFWARSMPRVFDDMMNLLSIFRYPKWVDLEFIYYPVFLTSESKPKNFGSGAGNWALNFHGKLMWTKRIFGEAGFGLKSLDFNREYTDASGSFSRLNYKFSSLYGTVGLGINF